MFSSQEEKNNQVIQSSVPHVASSPSGEEKPFSQMTTEEKDRIAHAVVMNQFMFTRTLGGEYQ